MDKIKGYITKNFEQLFVLVVLVSIAGINYFIPYKLAFLNFYFIPVLIAANYLGLKRSLMGGVFCILMVTVYAVLYPEGFVTGASTMDIALNISTWACFLILTGAIVGKLQGLLESERQAAQSLTHNLTESRSSLLEARRELEDFSHGLEKKVSERTEVLEKSKHAVEDLKQKVEDALYSTMDPEVVKLLIEKRLRTEKRHLSVMFADLGAFTQYSEDREPETVITDLNRWLGNMEEVLSLYHAHIDKYLGDGIMAEFGAPVHYEQHCLMAVLAGLRMQDSVSKGKYPWPMRVGVATGEATIGLIGRHRQSYTAIGDTVNVASRIQHASEPGRVTIDRFTYEAVEEFVRCQLKSLFPADSKIDPDLVRTANDLSFKVDANPDDADVVRRLALLLHKNGQVLQAHDYLRKALELLPQDQEIKLAYAEASLAAGKAEATALRGKTRRLRLYEVLGLKDPLLDRQKFPEKLFKAYGGHMAKIASCPENLILPVEALDGCVGHSRAVGFLAYCLASALDLPDLERRDALEAGCVLDMGKTIVSHHLLNRPGGLSKDEFGEVAKHSRESVRRLRQLGWQNDRVLDLVAAHHENFNGSGYPAGLVGDKIPLGGRILAIADAYDAMTSWRPYRNRWTSRAAFNEIAKDTRAGKFDPKLTALLGRLLEIED